jgi:hypothetical protein
MIRPDRVGRGSIVDSQNFVRDLLALGTRLWTRDAGEIRLDSAMDELVAAVEMAVARHENDVRKEKMRAVYQRRVAAGHVVSNRPPYGLTLTEDRRLPQAARAESSALMSVKTQSATRIQRNTRTENSSRRKARSSSTATSRAWSSSLPFAYFAKALFEIVRIEQNARVELPHAIPLPLNLFEAPAQPRHREVQRAGDPGEVRSPSGRQHAGHDRPSAARGEHVRCRRRT